MGRISRDRRAPLRVGRRGGELGAISSNHWRPSGVENRGVRKSERKLLVFWRFLAPFYHWPLGCLLSLHVYRMSCVVCVYCVCVEQALGSCNSTYTASSSNTSRFHVVCLFLLAFAVSLQRNHARTFKAAEKGYTPYRQMVLATWTCAMPE